MSRHEYSPTRGRVKRAVLVDKAEVVFATVAMEPN